MGERHAADSALLNTAGPIEIAPRLWWVGHQSPDEALQCNVYLLEQGDQSVLFDPGSRITFADTLAKVTQVVPVTSIRWIVCHHQDPDIVGALDLLLPLISRPDARIVSHHRAAALLRHLDLSIPFWLVEEHDWELPLVDRTLRFVFTPYAHFAGAFTTFDPATGTLLSSDLLGGFGGNQALWARDMADFAQIRRFHEHYMPSRQVLTHALDQFAELPVERIAPQHGQLIPKLLIDPIVQRLRQLECGLYLLPARDSRRLHQLDHMLSEITQTLLVERDFSSIAAALTRISAEILPVVGLSFFVPSTKGRMLSLTPETRYRGSQVVPPDQITAALMTPPIAGCITSQIEIKRLNFGHHTDKPGLIIPLLLSPGGEPGAVVVVRLGEWVGMDGRLPALLDRLGPAIEVAVEREAIRRSLEIQRDKAHHRSIRDPLTNLFTRRHMRETVARWTGFQDRDPSQLVSVVMLDLDHFKRVNDTFGHGVGDVVLKRVAHLIATECRDGDLAVRMGGEEFAAFLFGSSPQAPVSLAGRILAQVRQARFEQSELRMTISAGTAVRRVGESLNGVIERADAALYEAKHAGRDRIASR
ncbi:MAG: diguanylate cyclase [Myxococcales bacterium]|nr:diguanylate cyclase [Myxococcales bacterium]